jgi:hypothetical protein
MTTPEISHLRISFNNHLQDITDTSSLSFDNTSTIYFTDGTNRDLIPSDSVTVRWYVTDTTGVKTFLYQGFSLPAVIDGQPVLPKSGYNVLYCEITVNKTGVIYGHSALSKCIYNLSSNNPPPSDPLYPGVPSSVNIALSEELLASDGKVMAYGKASFPPWGHLVGGMVGDLNMDGVVNTTDLLLFSGQYGQTAED